MPDGTMLVQQLLAHHTGWVASACGVPLTGFSKPREPVAHLLEEDLDLLEAVPAAEQARAREALRARVISVERGGWEPPDLGSDSYGLFVLEGLLIRSTRLGRASAAEVLGPGDILRPWDRPLLFTSVTFDNRWKVLEPARLAVLDGRVSALISHWPTLSVAVAGRLLRRARCLSYLMAAGHFTLVEDRLLATLWHIGSMWGRVTPAGLVVPWKLTHEQLGELVGARRPSVTTALVGLQRRGRLMRRKDGCYVLQGDPPQWKDDHDDFA